MNLRPILIAAALLAAVTGSAQYSAPSRRIANASNVALQKDDGTTVVFPADASRKLVDAETGVAVGPDTPVRDGARLKDAQTGEVFTVRVPSRYLTVGIYFASFGIAGPIQQSDDSFAGGTDNANNPLFALDGGIPLPKHKGTLGVGGWFFISPNGSENDLYQVHVRYGLPNNNPLGVQVAYLNSQNRQAPGMTYHATYTVSSAKFAGQAKPWSIEFGAGVLNSTGDQVQEDGRTEHRNTFDPSFYVNGSWSVGKNVSAMASLWVVRERNQDLTRIALGVAYRF